MLGDAGDKEDRACFTKRADEASRDIRPSFFPGDYLPYLTYPTYSFRSRYCTTATIFATETTAMLRLLLQREANMLTSWVAP